jgi:hypothetical protein
MGDHNGTNGGGDSKKSEAPAPAAPEPTAEFSAGHTTGAIEYYILCPQRETETPGLITHLISRDICEKRQSENYHKCPNCVRSRIWRLRNGLPVEAEPVASR